MEVIFFFWWEICFAFYCYDKFHFKKNFDALHWREKIKQLANIYNILSYSQHIAHHFIVNIFLFAPIIGTQHGKKETSKQTFLFLLSLYLVLSSAYTTILPYNTHTFFMAAKTITPFCVVIRCAIFI